jgi:acetyl esterase/lipase
MDLAMEEVPMHRADETTNPAPVRRVALLGPALALLMAAGCGATAATPVATGGTSSTGGSVTSGNPTGGSVPADPGTTGGAGGASAPASGGRAGTDGSGGSAAGGSTTTDAGAGGTKLDGPGGGGAPDGSSEVAPPVQDASSRSPIAPAPPGYKVEGNVIYGPLPAQRLDVLYPDGAGPGGSQILPGVIFFHGGGWTGSDKTGAPFWVNRYLSHGFVVATVEYRRADGSAIGAIAPAAVEDALLAAKWFWDHLDYYHVDRTKYVVSGGSAGGHLALMVGMATAAAQAGPVNPTDFRIAAIVNGYGPTDVADLIRRNISFAIKWLPANTPDRDAIAARMSPMTYVRKDIPPLLTVQGDGDTTVPVDQNQKLLTALTAVGAEASLHLEAGAGHGFTDSSWLRVEKVIFDFLTSHGIGK